MANYFIYDDLTLAKLLALFIQFEWQNIEGNIYDILLTVDNFDMAKIDSIYRLVEAEYDSLRYSS